MYFHRGVYSWSYDGDYLLQNGGNCLIGDNCSVAAGAMCQSYEYAPQLYSGSTTHSLTAGYVSYVCSETKLIEFPYSVLALSILLKKLNKIFIDAGGHQQS